MLYKYLRSSKYSEYFVADGHRSTIKIKVHPRGYVSRSPLLVLSSAVRTRGRGICRFSRIIIYVR